MKAPFYILKYLVVGMLQCSLLVFAPPVALAAQHGLEFIDQQIAEHEGLTGVLVLDKGEEALLARAWLADHATESIEVQYFIWSSDNIGKLATEALLRAAERGVRVRVIVDDLLIDAPDKTLLALALHENIQIRIYNPKHSVGTSFIKRIKNVVTDFRGVNQRMHDKTFIVDGKVVITGGRNMANEYFDYDQEYNFRDRDVLALGQVVADVKKSFERFWKSELCSSVEQRFSGIGIFEKKVTVNNEEIRKIYSDLHQYAILTENFALEVRRAISDIPADFARLAKKIVWTDAQFISDIPGKNKKRFALDGGGEASLALAELISKANKKIVIQSPYLVLSDEAEDLFRKAVKRGVEVLISTNSLASTDNLQAFSGYKKQRKALVKMGLKVVEYKPHPRVQQQLLERYQELKNKQPVFAIHAKTMVIDSEVVYIGTYNLDPRSENLNTEVGIIMKNEALAKSVEKMISVDMLPENSWLASDKPDKHAPLGKRLKVLFWQMMPIKSLL